MSVTAAVVIDISEEPPLFDDGMDRRALEGLEYVPDGARVIVNVGSRRWLTSDTAFWLHRHADRLEFDLRGTPKANLRAFVEAARTGQIRGVA